jgi:hypothetical protein
MELIPSNMAKLNFFKSHKVFAKILGLNFKFFNGKFSFYVYKKKI